MKPRLRNSLEAYAYLAPAALILSTFWFIPVIIALLFSFFDATALVQYENLHFVGLGQYKRAFFQDEEFVHALWNTLNFAIYAVPPTLGLSLLAAMLLNTQLKGRAFFRTAFFLPHVTTWVAIAIVFKYLYHREFGLANYLLSFFQEGLLGVDPGQAKTLQWLSEPAGIWEMLISSIFKGGEPFNITDKPFGLQYLLKGPSLAQFSIIITAIWRDVGYYMIIFLAGLQNIDKTYYEAADIDGATPFQKFKHITFPLLSPVTFFLMVISGISAFKEFEGVYVMTPQGGPDYSTATIVYHLFYTGFQGQWELSYASAIAYILTIIILILTVAQNKIFGKRVEYEQ